MAFSDFSYADVFPEFGLNETPPADLFAAVPPIPSPATPSAPAHDWPSW